MNTVGSFYCACQIGTRFDFEENGCKDIDECETSSACHHICSNTLGGKF